MREELLKAIPIYFSSMVKFFFGPLGSYAAGLNILTSILVTVAGMMTVVLIFAFFGTYIREVIASRIKRKRKLFTPKNRRIVRIWRHFGIAGIAILTPVLFTPIVGAALAVSFGAPRQHIIFYMFISASVWAVLVSVAVYLLGDEVVSQYTPLTK